MGPQTFSSHKSSQRGIIGTILSAGLLAGILDGLAACVNYYFSTGNHPIRVFQYIASAFFGKEAFAGGWRMASWGILFHMLIATAFATLFFFLLPVFRKLSGNKIVVGIVYGLLVWAIMNLLVVPLTRAPKLPFQIKSVIIGIVILITMVGIPISLIVYKRKTIEKPSM